MSKATKTVTYTLELSEAEYEALKKLATALQAQRVMFRGTPEDAWEVIAALTDGYTANILKYIVEVE